MTKTKNSINFLALWVCLASFFAASLSQALSLPPRFYHKTLIGANFLPIFKMSVTGNVNPLDPGYSVTSAADIEADLVFAGYAQSIELFGRSAVVAYLQPMGDMSIESTNGTVPVIDASASGFGDPFFELNINLIGPEPQYLLSNAMRYKPKFSLDLILDLSVPLGEYDEGEVLNMGMNRFWGRVGFPMIWQIGDVWAPGHRTSFELLPALIWMGDNDDYGPTGDMTQETDLGYSVAAHLTKDINDTIWVSLDYTYMQLGDTEVGPVDSDGQDFSSIGVTIGTQLTRHLFISAGYDSTINDDGDDDVQMSTFSLNATFFWAPILDGLHRIGGEH
jgi:hypothetical protein